MPARFHGEREGFFLCNVTFLHARLAHVAKPLPKHSKIMVNVDDYVDDYVDVWSTWARRADGE